MDGLMDTAPCGFVSFADEGSIVDVNLTLSAMLGHAREDLRGRQIEVILPPGGRIFYHTYLFPMLKMHGLVEEVYFPFRTKDGRDIPMLLNARRSQRGGRWISDCVCMRMLQRHEYEEQLLQARRSAEEANAAKGRFLSMMSHDLRTPLTTIYGNANLLGAEPEASLNPFIVESVASIRIASQTLMSMINDILEFARLDSGRVAIQMGAVAVAEAVGRAESLVRLQLREGGLSFDSSGCDTGSTVSADPDRLQQILLNLLTNAIKFTPPGGTVGVRCEEEDERVRIHVSDTGVGIPSEQLATIFSPFVQLDHSVADGHSGARRGVGLGLAISRELARAMNGDVTAQSTPGTGSVFTVELRPARAPVPA